MKIVSKQDLPMNIFFDETNQRNKKVTMGLIKLDPGVKSPEVGFARHDQDEYSYVISGVAHIILEDGQDIVGKQGDAQWIEAGEGHINYNDGDEPAEVVWMLVERS